MICLSLFDGMSCGQIALNRGGHFVKKYYASEVDKHAIAETLANFPDTIQIGDVRDIDTSQYLDVDLLIGGSPCQSFSFAGKGEGMSTTSNLEITTLEQYIEAKNNGFKFKGYSYLFWEYVRVLRDLQKHNPGVKFMLENVMMIEKWKNIITETLGVEPIEINSALVSAQNRRRLYWTNITDVNQPRDKGIALNDIVLHEGNPASIVGRRINSAGKRDDYNKDVPIIQSLEVKKTGLDKSNCLTTVQKDNVLTSLPSGRHMDVYGKDLPYRNYELVELCRLQTIPDDYFKVSSKSQAMKMLGNGWTVDVIVHIFKNLCEKD